MVKNYISSRLLKGDILDIHSTNYEDLSPIEHSILRNAQPTSIDVERSFSKLKKLLEKDRPFLAENVCDYIICYCNSDI